MCRRFDSCQGYLARGLSAIVCAERSLHFREGDNDCDSTAKTRHAAATTTTEEDSRLAWSSCGNERSPGKTAHHREAQKDRTNCRHSRILGLAQSRGRHHLAVGTLYVAVAPVGDPDALTLRTLRLLREVALVACAHAQDIPHVEHLLAHHGLTTPVVGLDKAEVPPTALASKDTLLLLDGCRPGPAGPSLALVRSAIEAGIPVASVPGPNLPVAALVASGLPADRFVYLGELPAETAAQEALLASVAREPRTLVAEASLPDLTVLTETLGQRPLVLTAVSEQGIEMRRWNTLTEAAAALEDCPVDGPCVLVIGGMPERAISWNVRALRAEIRARLDQGLAARDIGRALARESGWPRREIYRLAVEMQSKTSRASHND